MSFRRKSLEVFFACVVALGAFALSPAAGAASVVPVTLMDGLPVIPVTLGSLKVDFLLDTGGPAAITVPRPLIVPLAGVVELPETTKTTDASGKVQAIHRVRVSSAILGAANVGPLEGLVNYRWGLSAGGQDPEVTKKGIVGLHAFSKRGLLLEIGSGRLTVFDADEGPELDGRWANAPFSFDKRGAVVRMDSNGRTAEVVLDSAASMNVMKKGSPVLYGRNNACKGKPSDALDCGVTAFREVRIGSGRMSGLDFAVIEMGEIPFDGILGIDFFKRHSVYLDFPNGRMYYRKSK